MGGAMGGAWWAGVWGGAWEDACGRHGNSVACGGAESPLSATMEPVLPPTLTAPSPLSLASIVAEADGAADGAAKVDGVELVSGAAALAVLAGLAMAALGMKTGAVPLSPRESEKENGLGAAAAAAETAEGVNEDTEEGSPEAGWSDDACVSVAPWAAAGASCRACEGRMGVATGAIAVIIDEGWGAEVATGKGAPALAKRVSDATR